MERHLQIIKKFIQGTLFSISFLSIDIEGASTHNRLLHQKRNQMMGELETKWREKTQDKNLHNYNYFKIFSAQTLPL